jgi:hypothetical protein
VTATDLQLLFVRDLGGFERELELLPDERLIWAVAPGVANSVGNLTLHVCGNLQHFVGHLLGGTPYLRDREAEFGRKSGSRSELVQEIRTTIAVIESVLPRIGAETLAREYPAEVGGVRLKTGLFLTHLAVHLGFHLGQAGYLRRVLTGDNRSANPIGLGPLASR